MGMTPRADLSARWSHLSPEKRALLEQRLMGQAAPDRHDGRIPQRPDQSSAPLSFAQERLWFLDQLEPGNAAYNRPLALRLSGTLDVPALEQSLTEIVGRHQVLRTTFAEVEGQPIQIIAPAAGLALPVVDFEPLAATARAVEARRLAEEEARRPFELAHGPLLRALLLRLSGQEYLLLLTMHHIVSDGWSDGILLRELWALYRAFAAGQPSPLAGLSIQYGDFAAWQRAWLQGEVLEAQLAYWRKHLGGAPTLLELPSDRPRPRVHTSAGHGQPLTVPPGLLQSIEGLCHAQGVTLFMALLAAFQTLLYRYTGQADILIGSPIANRHRAQVEGLIGFFANTLVLRTDLSGDPTFLQLLERVRQVCLDAYAHQDLPFEKLVEELQPDRDLSHSPLFQVMLVLQNAPQPDLHTADLRATRSRTDTGAAQFDLVLSLAETVGGLQGEMRYRTDLFDAATIQRMAGHFLVLLEAIAADPDQTISTLPLLTRAERQQLLVDWNEPRLDLTQQTCLHQLVERQVDRNPDALAVAFRDQQLSYRQLNVRANQTAHHLRRLGVGPEIVVGLFLDRSPEMIVGLLAVLKAGGAFLPLDPTYPSERLAHMLGDTEAPVVVTRQDLRDRLPDVRPRTVCLDTDWGVIAQECQSNPDSGVGTGNLAYVIYTSGSTGLPKGVMIEHGGLCDLATAQIRTHEVGPDSRYLHLFAVGFDASIGVVARVLSAGAALELAPEEMLPPGPSLVQLMRERHITHLNVVPSLLELLPAAELPDVRVVIVGGEVCSQELVQRWAPGRKFFNAYGPTEATVGSTLFECTAAGRKPLIGRPVANKRVHLLDAHLQPVPVGVPGEIYIGGGGLARGYLRRPALTAEAFVPDPFSQEPGARLYRTGDLARYMPDGNIDFLGRGDSQVKIRGFRIELGEIAARLDMHPQVRQAAVLAAEAGSYGQRLVAYVVPDQTAAPTADELRQFLAASLPDYMIPAAFLMLDALPLTATGKIDHRALPVPDGRSLGPEKILIAPSTPLESTIAGVWQEVLGLERVGVHDNFFDLGGHSLLAMQVIARLEKELGIRTNPRELMVQTLGQLASSCEERLREPREAAPAGLAERLRAAIKGAVSRGS
jgi:amino acid adenylation domain-containing protein